jgi:hypothetical protein
MPVDSLYPGLAMSANLPFRFLKEAVDQCYHSRFYARVLEYYYLEADQPTGSLVACPMLECGSIFPDAKVMLVHLKSCGYVSTGEFECPRCSGKEKFATISRKRCSWGKTSGLRQWVQSNIRAPSARFNPLYGLYHTPPPFSAGNRTASVPNFDMRNNISDILEYGPFELEQGSSGSVYLPISYPYSAPPMELMGDSVPELQATAQAPINVFGDLPTAQAPGSFPVQYDGSPVSSDSDSQGRTHSDLVSPTLSTDSSGSGTDGNKYTQLSSLQRTSQLVNSVDVFHALPYGAQQSLPSILNDSQDALFNSFQSIPGLVPTKAPWPMNQDTAVSGQENIQRSLTLKVKTQFPERDAMPAPLALKMYAPVSVPDPQDVPEAQIIPENDAESLLSPINYSASALEFPQTTISSPIQPLCSSPSLTETDAQDFDSAESIVRCPKCGYRPTGKRENYSSYMSKHKKVHEAGRVPCPDCAVKFTRRDNMMQHRRRTHLKRLGSSSSIVKDMSRRKKISFHK